MKSNVVAVSPHIYSGNNTRQIMLDLLIALAPAGVFSIVLFGWSALIVILASITTAVITEYVCQKVFKKKVTINDYSAVVTGLLLAFCLPPSTPWWAVVLGSFFAVAVAKQFFGGIGCNIFNPALAGRAFLLASYPVIMTTWLKPFDTITTATPLGIIKGAAGVLPTLSELFYGTIAGSLGETSVLLLLIGAAYLFIRRVIDWRIPFSFIGVFALCMFFAQQDVLFHLCAGGLILGAFFMATDYTTSPMTTKGKLIFGAGCGVLVSLIRLVGGYPEGVCYSILIMNMFVPLIDRIK